MRQDLDIAQGLEAICYCRYTETFCGTDNVTYDSQCQLNAAIAVKNMPIGVSRDGPCNSGIPSFLRLKYLPLNWFLQCFVFDHPNQKI